MNSPNDSCSRCGATLPAEANEQSCQRCLLEIGLESGTDFSLDNLAETLPHRGESVAQTDAQPSNDRMGLQRYRDLQAVHDWSGGTVYRAFHEGLARFVLLRVLESSADDDARKDFLRRAEKLSHVNHAHIASTLEAGVDHGAAYVAEEWLDAVPVDGFHPRRWRERWREGFFPNPELMQIMRDAASGLDAIHRMGITHGRINPDSVVIDRGGIVKLVGLGEAAESADDRFAMPLTASGASVPLAESALDSKLNGYPSSASIAADLFRLGASFCFLSSGKLPSELDPDLDLGILARRLKQHNPGLRSDLCRVIATCVARDKVADVAGQPTIVSDDRSHPSTQNPYESTARDGPAGYATAADLVAELNQLLQSGVQRAHWRTRFYSGHLEALGCLFIIGSAFSVISDQYEKKWNGDPVSLALLFYLFPILYVIVFESVLGWTIVRRLFGMRLLNHAGERSVWWRRLWRATLKSLLLVLMILLPAMIVPLISRNNVSMVVSMTVVPILTLILPAMAMYLPSRWIRSRWTAYDLLAGVTWGEETRPQASQTFDLTPAIPRRSRMSSPTGSVDQYELYEQLGSGGMGHVYRGRDNVLGRDVAIKLLSGSLVENPLLLERFQREARLAAKVNHPGVAKVFDNGVWHRTPYIAMELVPGSNLQQRIKAIGQLPLASAWDYITQAAEALRIADRSGVVHRDIKPANLMVTDDGRLKVTDFGVSRSVRLESEAEYPSIAALGMTDVGTIVGTPAYMAPEQAMGKDVDCRCDIYALGMTLYHMLSGHAPFTAKNAVEMLAQQMSQQPPTLLGHVSDLTVDQAAVLARMIAKQPAERYGSYEQLLDDLNRHAPGATHLASPLKRLSAEVCNMVTLYLLFTFGILISYLGVLQTGSDNAIGRWVMPAVLWILMLAIAAMYIIGVGRRGRTTGKRLLGIQVARASGERVGYGRAAVRFAVAYPLLTYFVPSLLFYVSTGRARPSIEVYLMYGLGFAQLLLVTASIVMMWIRSDRRTLHDLAAGTTVIHDKR